ncbi:MAG: helix-turn-helix transcriptional regulator [Rhizobiaceae bacterium]
MCQSFQFIDNTLTDFDLRFLTVDLSEAANIADACATLERHLRSSGCALLSMKVRGLNDDNSALRPFFGTLPCPLSVLSRQADSEYAAAMPTLHRFAPFDAMALDPSRYPDFMSRRFLDELKKLGHRHIAIIPVVIGDGLALYTIGLNDVPFAGECREVLVNIVCHATVSILSRFPETATLFKPRELSLTEAEIVLLLAGGNTVGEVAENLGYSEFTVSHLVDGASEKLGARSRAHLVAKALGSCEIANVHG